MSCGWVYTDFSIIPEFGMKNLSVFVNYTQGGSYNLDHSPVDYGHRQGRTYGPLVSFLLATFLTKAVAKYAASSLFPISHQPWINNKPVNYLSFNQVQQPDSIWRPASPYVHGLTAFAAESYHDHFSPPDPFQPGDYHSTETPRPHLSKYDAVDTTIDIPDVSDQIPSQSQYNYRRQPPPNRWNYYPRRNYPPQRRENGDRFVNGEWNRYNPNRFRSTTPHYDYYDYYEDLTTRQPPYRTRRPPPLKRRPTTENYEYLYYSSEYDDSSYEDYFERTTKYYEKATKPSKRRRKPTKKIKIKKRTDLSEESIESGESIEEIDAFTLKDKETHKEKEIKPQERQQMTTTESSTTTDSTESTSTEQTTTTTTTTTQSTPNITKPTGYGQGGNYDHISFTYGPPVEYAPPYNIQHNGYGPSNGNERISITQNPSTFPLFYHNFPYANLFPQELTKNAIVQKVQDIVGFEHDFVHRHR